MKIEFDKGVKEYLLKKDMKSFHIDHGLQGCCGVSGICELEVTKGVPDTGSYRMFQVDGFDIYVNNMLKFKDYTMKIVFSSFLFSKKLAVDGYDYSE